MNLSPPLRLPIAVVRLLCVLGALTLIAAPLWFWTSPEVVREHSAQFAGTGEVTVNSVALQLGAAVTVLPVGLGLYTLWQLWSLFGEYAAGRVFGRAALQRLRRFAWALLGMALLAPLMRTVMSVLLTFGNPPGRRMLVLGLSWNDYLAVLVAAVFITIATVMAAAVRLAEENEGFV
jgi:hypothetical protein